MKIQSLFLALPLLLSPSVVQASDNLKHGSSAIWCLRQVSDTSGHQLPQDLLNVLGQDLIDLEPYGVWFPEAGGKSWVPHTRIMEVMTAFRDGKSSEADIMAILESKEQIKGGLLKKLSAQWQDGLEDLMKEHRRHEGQLNHGKAYGAAFLAYVLIELTPTRVAPGNVPPEATWSAARTAAGGAIRAVKNTAGWSGSAATWSAANIVPWDGAHNAAGYATRVATEQKLLVLGTKFDSTPGGISYDLSELFSLMWLIENGHEPLKMAFKGFYKELLEVDLDDVKAKIAAVFDEAALRKPELKGNIFIQAMWRNLDALEKFVLAK